MNLGKRLRALREEKKITQEQLGAIINLSKANISKYESGDVEPNNETLQKLADLFDVSTDYLFGRSDERKSSNIFPQNDQLDKYDNIKKLKGIAADDGNNEVNDDLLRDVNNYVGFRLKQIEEEKKKK